jgi:hypothetical protein
MGAAYYIVLEKEIEGLDTMMNGKSLSRHMKSLDKAAQELGVRPLSKFFSMSPEDLAEFMDGDIDNKLPPLEQFSAKDGLATVKALLAHKPIHLDHVVEDLRECERILAVAAEHGVGWHLQIDV